MYYPFLRGRQFELIALRDLANEGILGSFITPIIEPVKRTHNNLNLASRVFKEQNKRVYLIVNPLVGEVKGDNLYYLNFLRSGGNFIPAFHYHNNADYIRKSIGDYELNGCMLISNNNVREEDTGFRDLVESSGIEVINIFDPKKNRELDRYLQSLNKTYIRLDDFFEKLPRNSDFLGIQEHRFSEEHLYFEDEGYNGFSDFTVLPSDYSDGGSTPRAVVIHLTYLNGQNKIWIRHFTSNSNDSIANVQGKFAEAAQKAVGFCRDNHFTNSAILELEKYFNNQHYPGLGTVKKIAIKNHLLVLHQYLSNR